MNCEDCLLMLDEFVENELDKRNVSQVSAHLEGCAECAGEYQMLRRELQAYSQYLPNIQATPALWINIQADFEKAGRERFSFGSFRFWFKKTFGAPAFKPAFAALSLTLLITLGIIIGLTKFKPGENSFGETTVSQKTDFQSAPEKSDENANKKILNNDKKDEVSKPVDKITIPLAANRIKRNVVRLDLSKPKNQLVNSKLINPNRKSATEEAVEKAERQYLSAITVLSRDIQRRRARLSPVIISQLEQSLAEIDNTITKTRRAAHQQPSDPLAVQYMTAAYAKKVELLRNIASN